MSAKVPPKSPEFLTPPQSQRFSTRPFCGGGGFKLWIIDSTVFEWHVLVYKFLKKIYSIVFSFELSLTTISSIDVHCSQNVYFLSSDTISNKGGPRYEKLQQRSAHYWRINSANIPEEGGPHYEKLQQRSAHYWRFNSANISEEGGPHYEKLQQRSAHYWRISHEIIAAIQTRTHKRQSNTMFYCEW